MSENGRCIKEVANFDSISKTAFGKHKGPSKSNVSTSLKNDLILSYIWSVIIYGSEALIIIYSY